MKILVVGESCIDKFVYGKIERLCPEAPVPVLKPIEVITNFGMSLNVVKNLKSLNSDLIINVMTQEKEITKTRFVEKKSNHIFIRVDEGENEKCDRLNIEKLENIGEYDIVIVSDYNKGYLSNDDILHIGRNSKLSILDSKRILNDEIIDAYTFIKLNKEEFYRNKHLKNKKNIIVTLGQQGAIIDKKNYKIKKPLETIDVSGAGDTFVVSFILKYYKTKNISKSIKFANKMASDVVSKRGISTPVNQKNLL
jgi:bifunctional ADP-heptose synthase (sugar kinase/adenylyltransferase)